MHYSDPWCIAHLCATAAILRTNREKAYLYPMGMRCYLLYKHPSIRMCSPVHSKNTSILEEAGVFDTLERNLFSSDNKPSKTKLRYLLKVNRPGVKHLERVYRDLMEHGMLGSLLSDHMFYPEEVYTKLGLAQVSTPREDIERLKKALTKENQEGSPYMRGQEWDAVKDMLDSKAINEENLKQKSKVRCERSFRIDDPVLKG